VSRTFASLGVMVVLASTCLLVVSILLRRFAGNRFVIGPLRCLGWGFSVVIGLCALPLALLELLLRRWANRPLWSLRRRQPIFSKHQIDGQGSWALPAQVAASRDSEFSVTHWNEMNSGLKIITKERWRKFAEGPELYRIRGEFLGSEFSFQSGERTTTGRQRVSSAEVLCLGGSTTFCMEVPDKRTWPSVLQENIAVDSRRKLRVRNLGISGTPGLERINTFLWTITPKFGDLAVFLFGDNDSGWKMYGARVERIHFYLPFLVRELLRASEIFELAGWLYGEISPRYLRRLAIEMANTTIAAAEQAHEFAKAKGARVLFVLQPNIFTLRNPDSWDRKIMAGTARDLSVLLEAAYGRYREWIATCDFAVDATNLFDNESPSPYMGDWAHVNTRGNQLIGEFVYKELKSRGWLSETTSV